MSDLREQVDKSSRKLKDIWALLSHLPPNLILPSKCYERWESTSKLHIALSGTLPLFNIRERAWNVVRQLVDSTRIMGESERAEVKISDPINPPPNFSHDGVLMDFSSARHLSLVSYVTVAWSIYDRLSNVCGRLAATDSLGRNPKQNPKLCEDFLARKKEKGDKEEKEASKQQPSEEFYGTQSFAYSTQHHLVHAYDWPARVTYTVRNWLVHEGYEVGSTRLFHTDQIEDGLRLHDEAVAQIERTCGFKNDGNGDSVYCCLRGNDNPWRVGQDKDLLEVLEKYHAELDVMFMGLVKWSVDSFFGQFEALAERDLSAIKSAAPPPAI